MSTPENDPARKFGRLETDPTEVGLYLRKDMEVGPYQLDKKLGSGGMGEVWRAIDPTRGDAQNPGYVALKFLPREIQKNPRELQRALETFRAVHALQHPNICPVYFLQEFPFVGHVLAMKYIDGFHLLEYRDAYVREHGEFPLQEVIRVLTPIAAALDYAHHPEQIHSGLKSVIHRDIKPENVLISRDGREVQIVDFGLAAQVRLSVSRVSNMEMESVGTRLYMAPEQWRGEFQNDKTDQYALAVLAYELIADRVPFDIPDRLLLRECVLNDSIPEIDGQPSYIHDVLQRALAKKRDDRFSSCREFVGALVEKRVVSKKSAPVALQAPFEPAAAKAAQRNWAEYLGQPEQWYNPLGMSFRLIPPGEFLMGNEETVEEIIKAFPYAKKEWLEDAYPRHAVRLTRPWFVGIHLVTLGQFRQFVEETQYRTDAERDGEGGWGWNAVAKNFEGRKPEYTWRSTGFPQSDRHPVVNVSWNDAQAMIAWLNDTQKGRKCPGTYRLPTEAESEYACRAGSMTRFPNGNDPEHLPAIANVWDGSVKDIVGAGYTNFIQAKDGYAFSSPVGAFASNAFGMYDTVGNACEWCQDWYGADYYRQFAKQVAVDPAGPNTGSSRCCRGGSWYLYAVNCRSAYRNGSVPPDRFDVIGFRLVLSVE